MLHRKVYAPAIAVVLLALSATMVGCGGGGGDQNAAQKAGQAANQAGQALNSNTAGGQAPIPAGLNCRSPIVWVNLTSGVYHEQGDPWYGRTKHGEYECMAAANAHGYHLAGSHHDGSTGGYQNQGAGAAGYSNGANNGYSSGGSMNNESTTSRHHRHHRTSTPSP